MHNHLTEGAVFDSKFMRQRGVSAPIILEECLCHVTESLSYILEMA